MASLPERDSDMKLGILTRSQLVTRLRSLRQDLETGLDYPDVPVPPALLLRDLCRLLDLNTAQTARVLGVTGLLHIAHVDETRYRLRSDPPVQARHVQHVRNQRKEPNP